MDIRITDGEAELFGCDKLSKEEIEFILYLMNKGGYWEFRKPKPDVVHVYDKDNVKYRGTIEEIKDQL